MQLWGRYGRLFPGPCGAKDPAFSASSSLFPYLSSTRTNASCYKEHLDLNIHPNKSIQKNTTQAIYHRQNHISISSRPHYYQNGKDKRPGNRAFLYLTYAFTNSSLITQTPLEKAHIVRAEKKKRREEIKAKRLAILKAAREKKAKAKKA